MRKEVLWSLDEFIPVFLTLHLKPVSYYSGLGFADKPFKTVTALILDHNWKWTHIPLYIHKHTLKEFSSHSFFPRFRSPQTLTASLRTCVPSLKSCGLRHSLNFSGFFFSISVSDSLNFRYFL